ncbi:MAG TPA: hypothetical protein VKF38_09345 [Anaerolineaceae bacterium]|nr:hypothetical protein [Anaerolineaceae bacterium]
MDDAERERREKMSKYFGTRELLRVVSFLMGWIFFGVIIEILLTVVFHISEEVGFPVFLVFLITAFTFPFVGRFWKPANSLLNKVIGNKNLNVPIIPLSTIRLVGTKKRPWYYYLPSVWGWLLVIALLYVVIKYLTK